MVVLNTCTHPRERRPQALRRAWAPQGAEGRAARACRSRWAAAWPRRSAGEIVERAPLGRRRRRHPQPQRRARSAGARARRGPDRRGPRRARTPTPRATRRRRSTRCASATSARVDDDPDRAATTPAPSASCPRCAGREVSRPLDDLVAEADARWPTRGVVEVTLLGQNVNSYGRDLTRRRPLFAELLRALGDVEGIERDPLHEPAPQGPAPRDDRARWPRRPRSARSCTCRCSPGRTGCSPPCAAATAPSATSRGSPRRARPSPTSRSRPTSSSASPARPTPSSTRPWPSSPRRSTTAAFTFIFSPRAGTRAAAMADELRAGRGHPRALRAPGRGPRPLGAAPRTRRASGASRRSWSRGRARRDPAMLSGRTRQGKLLHFARRRGGAAPGDAGRGRA